MNIAKFGNIIEVRMSISRLITIFLFRGWKKKLTIYKHRKNVLNNFKI